jgi:hypothetical protein
MENIYPSLNHAAATRSMSSPISDSKAESPVEVKRVLSSDNPNPVETDPHSLLR